MGAGFGMALGALNVAVIAIAMAMRESAAEVFVLVAAMGLAPGMFAGGALGWIAHRLPNNHPVVRWLVIAVPAVGVVVVLGGFFEQHALIVYASIPTIAIASILERASRARPAPPIPIARALDV